MRVLGYSLLAAAMLTAILGQRLGPLWLFLVATVGLGATGNNLLLNRAGERWQAVFLADVAVLAGVVIAGLADRP